MTHNEDQASLVDLEMVQDEVGSILATISWTRAQLEDVKEELLRWIGEAAEGRTPNPALSQQHDAADDQLDHAIVAEHERVADEPD